MAWKDTSLAPMLTLNGLMQGILEFGGFGEVGGKEILEYVQHE